MTSSVTIRSKRIIILIHALIWIALLLIPLLFIESQEGMRRYITFGGAHLVFIAGYFYINYLFFIPKFLLRKNFRAYILTVLVAMVLISLINVIYDLQIHNYFFPGAHHLNSVSRSVFGAIFSALFAFGLSTSIRITDEWIRNEKLRKEMETEKLTSELAFLKSQVNPHFLFNILNNICSLARKKSDDTENAIIKLSQIMRYMLYDSKDAKVSLEKEVEYLQNYIELQRMRISGEDRKSVV
jgi:two-component system LytT family sensor kinase